MKKTIITISAAAVMAVAAVCIFCTVKANENPFLNANVEALARTESTPVCTGPKKANLVGKIFCQSTNTAPCQDMYGCD